MFPSCSNDSSSSGYDSSPCPSSPDYNDSPPYNRPSIKPTQRLLPFKGWLSMAPQVDDPIPVTQIKSNQQDTPAPSSTTSPSLNQIKQPEKPIGYSYKPLSPRKAVFSVGTDDEDDTMEIESPVMCKNNNNNNNKDVDGRRRNQGVGSVSSVVQVSYPGSHQPPASLEFLKAHGETVGGEHQKIVAPTSSNPLNHRPRSYSQDSDNSTTYGDSPPEFDVRASFAPMPKYGVGVGLTVQPLLPQTSDQVKGLHSISNQDETSSSSSKRHRTSSNYEIGPGGMIKINGGGGLSHGKREYKGLTAHAVEQEMEEMGDESVMSHAPDPFYLASRLEGLRKNLEEEDKSPGGRRGGWVEWVGEFEPEEINSTTTQDVEILDNLESSNPEIKINDEELTEFEKRKKEEDEKEEEERRLKRLPASPAPTAASNPFLNGFGNSEISSTLPSSFKPISSMTTVMERSFTSDSIASIVPETPSNELRRKAIEERLEIRNIKRTDLEQVRELHCFHGDGEKHDAETYTTSAPFLLRLLVDEKHVCLVAVERPLPEPVALPNREELSNSISSLDQRIEERIPLEMNSSSESLPFPTKNQEEERSHPSSDSNLFETKDTLRPSSINLNSQPSSGTASSNSVSEFGNFSATDSRFSFLRSNGHTQGLSLYNPRSNRHQNPQVGGINGGKEIVLTSLARSEITAPTSIGCSDTDDMYGAPTSKSMATIRSPAEIQMNLVGPTYDEDTETPRTIKVMALPPPGGLRAAAEAETVLAVATATIGIKENNENMWADHSSNDHVKEFEAHVLTLSIAPEERSQGLGKLMLESLIEECKRRANESSSRSSSTSRSRERSTESFKTLTLTLLLLILLLLLQK